MVTMTHISPSNLFINWLMVVTGLLVFATGLVLFFAFHIGEGAFTASAFGISRLVWLNVHRLSAAVLFAAAAFHVALHGRALLSRVSGALETLAAGAGPGINIVFYLAFCITAVCGFAAWFFVPGTTPLDGPLLIGLIPPWRHPWLDVHNMAGLAALALSAHHLAHRWRRMTEPAASGPEAPAAKRSFRWRPVPRSMG